MLVYKKVLIYPLLKILKGLAIVFIIVVTVQPFIYMLSVSLSDNIYIVRNEVKLLPKGFNLRAYEIVLKDSKILRAYWNTNVYVVTGTLISLLTTIMAAYALSKKRRLIFHKFFSIMIIIPMFFNGGLIPTYLTVRSLGLYNNIWAVIIPGAISSWYVIVSRSFFDNFPSEIEESGAIDGLNDIGIFVFLVLPLSKVLLATIGLFYAVGLWNAFFGPFIYLSDPEKFPLQVFLRSILLQGILQGESFVRDQAVIEESMVYTNIIVSIIPIIAVYPFLQKYFVKGIMVGSIKG